MDRIYPLKTHCTTLLRAAFALKQQALFAGKLLRGRLAGACNTGFNYNLTSNDVNNAMMNGHNNFGSGDLFFHVAVFEQQQQQQAAQQQQQAHFSSEGGGGMAGGSGMGGIMGGMSLGTAQTAASALAAVCAPDLDNWDYRTGSEDIANKVDPLTMRHADLIRRVDLLAQWLQESGHSLGFAPDAIVKVWEQYASCLRPLCVAARATVPTMAAAAGAGSAMPQFSGPDYPSSRGTAADGSNAAANSNSNSDSNTNTNPINSNSNYNFSKYNNDGGFDHHVSNASNASTPLWGGNGNLDPSQGQGQGQIQGQSQSQSHQSAHNQIVGSAASSPVEQQQHHHHHQLGAAQSFPPMAQAQASQVPAGSPGSEAAEGSQGQVHTTASANASASASQAAATDSSKLSELNRKLWQNYELQQAQHLQHQRWQQQMQNNMYAQHAHNMQYAAQQAAEQQSQNAVKENQMEENQSQNIKGSTGVEMNKEVGQEVGARGTGEVMSAEKPSETANGVFGANTSSTEDADKGAGAEVERQNEEPIGIQAAQPETRRNAQNHFEVERPEDDKSIFGCIRRYQEAGFVAGEEMRKRHAAANHAAGTGNLKPGFQQQNGNQNQQGKTNAKQQNNHTNVNNFHGQTHQLQPAGSSANGSQQKHSHQLNANAKNQSSSKNQNVSGITVPRGPRSLRGSPLGSPHMHAHPFSSVFS